MNPTPFTDEIHCPTEQQLAAFVEEQLPERVRPVAAAHVEICGACRDYVRVVHYLLADRAVGRRS